MAKTAKEPQRCLCVLIWVGVIEPNSAAPLFSQSFTVMKIVISCGISRSHFGRCRGRLAAVISVECGCDLKNLTCGHKFEKVFNIVTKCQC